MLIKKLTSDRAEGVFQPLAKTITPVAMVKAECTAVQVKKSAKYL